MHLSNVKLFYDKSAKAEYMHFDPVFVSYS